MSNEIDKPEGFDMRDKRSDKTNSAELWTPRDALYSASQAMSDKAKAITVIWLEVDEHGQTSYHRRNAGPRHSTLDLTVTALGQEMRWVR